jgi:hypothetical protein
MKPTPGLCRRLRQPGVLQDEAMQQLYSLSDCRKGHIYPMGGPCHRAKTCGTGVSVSGEVNTLSMIQGKSYNVQAYRPYTLL